MGHLEVMANSGLINKPKINKEKRRIKGGTRAFTPAPIAHTLWGHVPSPQPPSLIPCGDTCLHPSLHRSPAVGTRAFTPAPIAHPLWGHVPSPQPPSLIPCGDTCLHPSPHRSSPVGTRAFTPAPIAHPLFLRTWYN